MNPLSSQGFFFQRSAAPYQPNLEGEHSSAEVGSVDQAPSNQTLYQQELEGRYSAALGESAYPAAASAAEESQLEEESQLAEEFQLDETGNLAESVANNILMGEVEELISVDDAIRKKEAIIADLHRIIADLHRQLAVLHQQLLQQALISINQNSFSEELANPSERLEGLKNEINTLLGLIQAKDEELLGLQEEIKTKAKIIKEQGQEMFILKGRLTAKNPQLSDQDKIISDLRRELEDQNQRLTGKVELISVLQGQLNNRNQQIANKDALISDNNSLLRTDLASVRANLQAARKQIKDLGKEYTDSEYWRGYWQEEWNKADASLLRARQKNEENSLIITNMSKEYADLKAQNDHLKIENDHLKQELYPRPRSGSY